MPEKEAKARIKINKLLEEAGWRFFDDGRGKANIVFKNNIKITEEKLNGFGEDFEAVKNGFIDFLLLDEKGFPFIVLEAKAEDKNPLFGKDQADKAFKNHLRNDYKTFIYKESRDDWRKAEIVVSTIQTFLSKNRYKRLFAPDDFDLVISDEAHRSIGGNSRAVFEYFIGCKLGLTATPKDYLKNINPDTIRENDPRELERRILLDTYKTFGCANSFPTFRYSLVDGVKEDFLVNPIVVDERTDITTQLLSEKGYAVVNINKDGEEVEETYIQKDFEKKFFSRKTNRLLCKTFLENVLRDPVSGEIGKTIAFCVSQNHAARVTRILNEFAHEMFPGKYQSDFAVQVTSRIADSQQFSINFTNNRLSGSCNFNRLYKTCKARVCVTAGRMIPEYIKDYVPLNRFAA